MKKMILLVWALACAAVFGQAISFDIAADRADCEYRCGEAATFTVKAVGEDGGAVTSGVVSAVVDNFGPQVQLRRRIDLSQCNPFTLKGRLSEPGFLRIRLDGKDCKKQSFGVAYEPTRIEQGSPSPADFDAFWAEARAKLAREVPLDAQVLRVPERCTADFDFFRISFATFGRRVYGYMSVPTDRTRAPYPVDFQVSAAGFGDWTNNMGGKKDAICVFFSVYPFEPHWDWKKLGLKAKYDALHAAVLKKYGTGYATSGITESREAYFFYPVLLGIDRAVDWVAARPDVDRRRFRYEGTSQGGGFGFYLTGLNHTFTRAVFYVPAITDTMGYLKGRQSGWPQIVESNSATPEKRRAAEANAPYFDGANFAARIRCPVRVAVGFADTTCAPCAVYAAYNAIPVKDKGIVHGIGMTHSCFGRFYRELGAWVTGK
ncbi:MAG: acetylxylan esterase [Kiritimatiellia bacterium]